MAFAALVAFAATGVTGPARAEGAAESLAAARALFDSGDYQTALVFYEKAAKQEPANAVAHAGVGKTRLKLGDAAGAVYAYQNAVRLAPTVPALQQALRQAQAAAARMAPPPAGWGAQSAPPRAAWARAPVAAAPRVAPMAAPAAPVAPAEQHRTQGIKHYEGGRYLFAIKSFEKAAALEPGNAEVHARMGDSYLALQRTKDAVAAYRKAVQHAPYNVEINLAFANALAADGDVEEAKKAYQAVLDIQPGEARAKEALAALKKHSPRAPAPAPAPAAAPAAAAATPDKVAGVASGAAKSPSKPEAVKPEPSKSAAKAEAPKAEPAKPEAPKAAAGKPEPAKPEPPKVAAKPETPTKGKPEAPPAEPPESAKGKGKAAPDDDLIGDLMADPLGKSK